MSDLSELAKRFFSPELTELLDSISEILVNHDYDSHLFELKTLISIMDDLDPFTMPDNIIGIINTALQQVFTKIGITVSDELDYTNSHRVLSTILDFGGDDDYQRIYDILNSDELDNVEMLAEILSLKNPFTNVSDYTTYIHDVSDDAISEMKRIIDDYISGLDGDQAAVDIMKKANVYYAMNDVGRVNLETLYSRQIPVGMGLETTLEALKDLYYDVPEPTILAKELFGLAIYSGTSMEAISDEIEFLTKDWYSTNHLHGKLMLATRQIEAANADIA